MERIEIRAVIKYLVKKGMRSREIYIDMKNTLGASAPTPATVCKWATEFQCGRQSVLDCPRSGRRRTATTPEIIKKVHDIISDSHQIKVSDIAKVVGISDERVYHILTEQLCMKKIDGKWVTVDQERVSNQISEKTSQKSLPEEDCNLDAVDSNSEIKYELQIENLCPSTAADNTPFFEELHIKEEELTGDAEEGIDTHPPVPISVKMEKEDCTEEEILPKAAMVVVPGSVDGYPKGFVEQTRAIKRVLHRSRRKVDTSNKANETHQCPSCSQCYSSQEFLAGHFRRGCWYGRRARKIL